MSNQNSITMQIKLDFIRNAYGHMTWHLRLNTKKLEYLKELKTLIYGGFFQLEIVVAFLKSGLIKIAPHVLMSVRMKNLLQKAPSLVFDASCLLISNVIIVVNFFTINSDFCDPIYGSGNNCLH